MACRLVLHIKKRSRQNLCRLSHSRSLVLRDAPSHHGIQHLDPTFLVNLNPDHSHQTRALRTLGGGALTSGPCGYSSANSYSPWPTYLRRPRRTSSSQTALRYCCGGTMEMIPDRRPLLIAPWPRVDSASSRVSLSRFLKAFIALRSSSDDEPSAGAPPFCAGAGESPDWGGSGNNTHLLLAARPPACTFVGRTPSAFDR